MRWLSKILIALMLIIFFLGSHQGLLIRARAQAPGLSVPTLETNPILVGSASGNFMQRLFEWGQRFVRETLRKRLLDMVVDQIITWIQGGGDPKFVTDWRSFLDDAVNIAVGDFVQEIGLGFLCSAFNFQVIATLQTTRFSQNITCTLDQIVRNIEDFQNDFRNGGWVAYTETLKLKNNYFGAVVLARDEAEKRAQKAREAAQNEALSGGGFLGTRNCQEAPTTTFPGPDLDGDGRAGDIPLTCIITTPAGTIGALAGQAVGVDIPYLLSAEELEAYVAAIADALINRLIREGVGLLQVSAPGSPAGGSVAPGAGACAGLTGQILSICRSYFRSSGSSSLTVSQQLLETITEVSPLYSEALGIFQDSQSRLEQYLRDLDALLDQCSNLDDEIERELAWARDKLTAVQSQATSTAAAIGDLASARTEIESLEAGDWIGLSTIQGRIQALLNSQQVRRQRDQAEIDNRDIIRRIEDQLRRFDNNCQP